MPTPQGWWQQQTMQNSKASKPSESCLRLETQHREHLPRRSKALGSVSRSAVLERVKDRQRERGREEKKVTSGNRK